MEYFLKRTLIRRELNKLNTGFFSRDAPADVNRARFLADIKDAYTQMQFRGMSYGLSLSFLTFYKYAFLETLLFRLLMMYIAKEALIVYYINDFFIYLEIDQPKVS